MGSCENSAINEISGEITQISPFLNSDERSDFRDFIGVFGKNLCRYTELSVSPHSSTVGVMTRGNGGEFMWKLREFINKSGAREKSMELFDEIAKYFTDINILIKYDFHEEKIFDFSLYWQYLVPVHLLSRMARKFDISGSNLKLLDQLSRIMRQRSLYLGLGFTSDGDVGFRVFFSNQLRKSAHHLSPSLAVLLAKTGVDADNINNFIAYHNYLSPVATGNVFTSVGFDRNKPLGAKIDYEIIPIEHVLQIMRALNAPRSEEESRVRMTDRELVFITNKHFQFTRYFNESRHGS
jgi:hypothetical protein